MNINFNKLSLAETERLAYLSEELGETQQIIGKILRHGYENFHPHGSMRNRRLLEKECGDVQHAMTLLFNAGDLSMEEVARHECSKTKRTVNYFHHQSEQIHNA